MNVKKKNQLALLLFALINIMLLLAVLKVNGSDGYFILDVPTQLYYGKYGFIKNLFFIKEERFFPLVYVVYILTANLLGNTPVIFMFVQVLFFAGMIGAVLCLFLQFEKNIYKLLLVSLLFYIVSPFAESYLSIGKQEWLLCFCFAIWSLSLFMVLETSKKIVFIIGTVINVFSLACALLAKETGIVLYAGLFVVLCGIFLSKQFGKQRIGILLLTSTIVVAIWLIYRKIYIVKGEYTTYSLTIYKIFGNIQYYLKYSFDVVILGVIGLITNIIYVKNNLNSKSIFALSMNLIGWGYFAGLACWHNAFCYYLYPVAFFFIVSFIGATQIEWKKMYAAITKVLAAIVIIPLLMYGYSAVVLTEEAYDAYSDSIHYLVNNVPNSTNILFETFIYGQEPIYQTNLLFDVLDKEVNVFGKEADSDNFSGQTIKEENYMPQKGDYIVVYNEQRDLWRPIRRISPAEVYKNGMSVFENNPEYDVVCVDHKEYSSLYIKGFRLSRSLTEYSVYYVQNVY